MLLLIVDIPPKNHAQIMEKGNNETSEHFEYVCSLKHNWLLQNASTEVMFYMFPHTTVKPANITSSHTDKS